MATTRFGLGGPSAAYAGFVAKAAFIVTVATTPVDAVAILSTSVDAVFILSTSVDAVAPDATSVDAVSLAPG
jgi:hypothetical protein